MNVIYLWWNRIWYLFAWNILGFYVSLDIAKWLDYGDYVWKYLLPLLIASSDNVASFINDVIQISTIWLYFLHDKKSWQNACQAKCLLQSIYINDNDEVAYQNEATCISLYSSLIPLLIFLLLIAVIKYAS